MTVGFSTLILTFVLPTDHFLFTWMSAANWTLSFVTLDFHLMVAFQQHTDFFITLAIDNVFVALFFCPVPTGFKGKVNHFRTIVVPMRITTSIRTWVKIAAHLTLALVLTNQSFGSDFAFFHA